MSKPSKRPGRAARDIHAAIRDTAAELRNRGRFGIREATDFPELADLMEAGRDAVAGAVPACFEFHGRRYYLRARLAIQLDIFDAPGAGLPLVCGVSFSTDEHGHAPGH